MMHWSHCVLLWYTSLIACFCAEQPRMQPWLQVQSLHGACNWHIAAATMLSSHKRDLHLRGVPLLAQTLPPPSSPARA